MGACCNASVTYVNFWLTTYKWYFFSLSDCMGAKHEMKTEKYEREGWKGRPNYRGEE